MKSRRWATWVVFTICALAVLEGLGWVTWKALRLERAEAEARAYSAFQEVIRLALWRMESEITPILAQEAARPYFHYQAFYPAERAYTRMLQACSPGEVLVPSPLLDSSGPYMRLHYQVTPDTVVTSPQAPTGNLRDLAEAQYVDSEYIVLAGARLGELTEFIRPETQLGALQWMREARQDQDFAANAYLVVPAPQQSVQSVQQQRAQSQWEANSPAQALSEKEYQFRQEAVQTAANVAPPENRRSKGEVAPQRTGPAKDEAPPPQTFFSESAPATNPPPGAPRPADAAFGDVLKRAASTEATASEASRMRSLTPVPMTAAPAPATPPTVDVTQVEMGPLEPVWRMAPRSGEPELILRRTVRVAGEAIEQGIWIDWPALRARLLGMTRDIIPGAELVPVFATPSQGAPTGQMLASIPVLLIAGPPPPPAPEPLFSAAHLTLIITWCAALGGIIAIGFVLRTSMELSDRRGRFVSAVTHELRTPLTTFRLYTGMLAGGMVKEEAARRDYLATLEKESGRLAGIVENVLDYARLGGRPEPRNGVLALDDLLAQVLPALERSAARCGMELMVERGAPDPAAVRADAATVERILLNLVDNACKYAREAADRRVHLSIRVTDRPFRGPQVEIRVRDHGPGIPRAERRRVFRAFHRARRDSQGPHSGLGLGLALSKGLARELGGDLDMPRDGAEGAELRLTLPILTRTEP
ncbi:MAG: HAMP domain-containing sensor histidine kinase [Phycisphaerales bacterium]